MKEATAIHSNTVVPEVDRALLELNLGLSPEERLRRHDEALELAEELRRAGEKMRNAEAG